MRTTVANIYHLPPGWEDDQQYVYIGRPGKGKPGPWGNPFRLLVGAGRGATLEQYRRWLLRKLLDEPDFRVRVAGLHGKTLVCFCKPNTCHGDILADAADVMYELEVEEDAARVLDEWEREAEAVYGDVEETAPQTDELPEVEVPDATE